MPAFVQGSETSEAAAKSIETDKGRAAVLAVLRQHPEGLTDEELQGLTGLSPSTERPRRVELWRSLEVFDSGIKRPTKTGRQAVVWRADSPWSKGEEFGASRKTEIGHGMPPKEPIGWKERARLAEASCDALRRTIDRLQLELAKAQGRKQQQPLVLGFRDDSRRSS